MIDYVQRYMPSTARMAYVRNDDATPDGVILTDSSKLADKFGESPTLIRQLLKQFVSFASNPEINQTWELIDVGTGDFNYILSKNSTWWAYAEVLDDYSKGMQWQTGIGTSLLIIGGDDVIPVPEKVIDTDMPNKLQVDLLYAFGSGIDLDQLLRDLVEKKAQTPSYDLQKELLSLTKFNVSRIPLPLGRCNLNAEAWFRKNLHRSLLNNSVIPLRECTMISADQWMGASILVASGLPIFDIEDIPDENHSGRYYVRNKVLFSPMLDLSRSHEACELVETMLHRSDLVVFNVHGSDRQSIPDYFGSNGEIAMSTKLLPAVETPIINSLACYGARYHGFDIEDSMLMSALGNNVLSFCGASATAYGSGNPNDTELVSSEHFISIYNELLLSGKYCVGEAFLRAKFQYFERSFGRELPSDIKYAMYVFNHFGNPLLKVQSSASFYAFKGGKNQGVPKVKYKSMDSRKTLYRSAGHKDLDDLYADVRNCVDDSLAALEKNIRETYIEANNPNAGRVTSIARVMFGEESGGYSFVYHSETGAGRSHVIITTDNDGHVLSILGTK